MNPKGEKGKEKVKGDPADPASTEQVEIREEGDNQSTGGSEAGVRGVVFNDILAKDLIKALVQVTGGSDAGSLAGSVPVVSGGGDLFHGKTVAQWKEMRAMAGARQFREGLRSLKLSLEKRNEILAVVGDHADHVDKGKSLPAGGHGHLFDPNSNRPSSDPNGQYALDQAIQSGFSVTSTGEPVSDLRYLSSKTDGSDDRRDPASNITGSMAGMNHVFKQMRTIALDDNLDDASWRRAIAEAFSSEKLEDLAIQVGAAEAMNDGSIQSFGKRQAIPCPKLLPEGGSRGKAENKDITILSTYLESKKFSGESNSPVSSMDFFTDVRSFLDGKFTPSSAYFILKSVTKGKAREEVTQCERMNAGFLYCWESITTMFTNNADPDEAEKKLINMRSERPTDVRDFLMRMKSLSSIAALSKTPEVRPYTEISRFREEAERMLRNFYPYCYKPVYARELPLRKRWITIRDQMVRRGENPDNCTVPYHPMVTLQRYIIEEVGDLVALDLKHIKRPREVHQLSADLAEEDHAPDLHHLGSGDAEDHGQGAFSDPGFGGDDASGENHDGSAEVTAVAMKPRFFNQPNGGAARPAAPGAAGGAKLLLKNEDPDKFRLCVLCTQAHQWPFCDIYRNMRPSNERCKVPQCQMWHPGTCKYAEAMKLKQEKAARAKARQDKKQ